MPDPDLLNSSTEGEVDNTELLIDEIHVRPALWDIRHADYKNRVIRPQLWQEVTKEAGRYCMYTFSISFYNILYYRF